MAKLSTKSIPTSRSIHLPRVPAAGAALCVLLLLGACGGGGGAAVGEPPSSNASALAASKPGELLAYVRGRLAARGPQGGATIDLAGDAPAWLTATVSTGGTVQVSGTTTQEQGVDEEDLIKSDGSSIYTLEPSDGDATGKAFARLAAYARGPGGKLQDLGAITLSTPENSWVATSGMVLSSDARRLAVVGQGSGDPVAFVDCPAGMACATLLPPGRMPTSAVQLQFVDVSNPARLQVPEQWAIDGRLVGTRQIGRMLYLVTAHAPQLAYDQLPYTANEAQRQAALAQLQASDVLPAIRTNGGARQPLVSDTDCWVQTANASTQVAVTTITAIDLTSPTLARTSRCFVGGSEALYMAPAAVYLATTRSLYQTVGGAIRYAPEVRTDIHKFAVSGADISYRGSGDVAGHLGWDREKTPYRMSEFNGDLRVLSFTGSQGWFTLADAGAMAASPATLTILRERTTDRSLQPLAALPNAQRPAPIGHAGEQVYAVRFFGDRAYVVTFRQTDPLYVLDLSNPADPKAVGELQIPGFSDYLFPLGDGSLLFGVGKDADAQGRLKGVKVGLFDVRDASKPTQLASQSFGDRGSTTALDYSRHGVNLMVSGSTTRIALPMMLFSAATPIQLAQQGVQRFEIDTVARTLATKPWIAIGAPGWMDLSTTRSLQIDANLYVLAQGKTLAFDW